MARDKKGAVRSHAQEREWLLNLGKGNIVEGVRSLIQYSQGEHIGQNGYTQSNREKAKSNYSARS